MEVLLLLLLAVVVVAVPICIVILLVGQSRLKARVAQLELGQLAAQTRVVAARADQRPLVEPTAKQPVMPVDAAPSGPLAEAEPVAKAPAGAQMEAPDAPVVAASRIPPPDQNRALVMRKDLGAALINWLARNWVYAISAMSLALAGVFLVQYGAERGLLSPAVRVVMAILLGAVLIGAGEWLRRRYGDGEAVATAFLPSVFSGAGLVSIFAGILAARQMYGLIGPEPAFAGLLFTAVLAVVLGWFYGPLLAAVGLLGAAAAPFLVGGGAPGIWLYGYFGLIAATGLAVDAVRRWAWVSVLALALGYAGGYLMLLDGLGTPGWAGLLTALALLAVALPVLRLIPDHQGPSVLQSLWITGPQRWPPFPVRIAAGAGAVSAIGLVALAGNTPAEGLLMYGALTLLALAYLLWADRAPGLADLALLPATGFLARLFVDAVSYWQLSVDFAGQAVAFRVPEAAAPLTVTILLGMAALISAASALRALRAGPFSLAFGLGAVLVAPVVAAELELLWNPSPVLGAYPWALHVMALAAAMVALALRFARVDGEDRRRVAYATLSALSLIALALFLLTTRSALTLSLGVLVVVAAGLDRRFRLPEMGLFIQIGVAVLGYRLLADPGVGWAMEASLGAVIVAFVGVIAALVAALWLLSPLDRRLPVGVLESAIAGFAAVFANVLISRWLLPPGAVGTLETHYGVTLNALPWLVLMVMQVYRAGLGGPLRWFRLGVAAVAGLLAAAGLLIAVFPMNPLFARYPDVPGALVRGPLVLDSLALAYAVPGMLLIFGAWRVGSLPRGLRLGFYGAGAALVALYIGLEIRRFWQGDWLGVPGVTQAELYTYTVALMGLGAGLLYQAIVLRSALLRRIAMAVIAVTIAKVFLIDASGLTGLTRVFSFLGLGLSLAGLAWLNRWAGQVSDK